MVKFLLDANLSPITASFIKNLGFDSKSITEEKLGNLTDSGVVEIARRENRMIITFDLDFGEIYHTKESGKIGVMVLRLENQTSNNVNFVLKQFVSENKSLLEKNTKSLIVIKSNSIRFVK